MITRFSRQIRTIRKNHFVAIGVWWCSSICQPLDRSAPYYVEDQISSPFRSPSFGPGRSKWALIEAFVILHKEVCPWCFEKVLKNGSDPAGTCGVSFQKRHSFIPSYGCPVGVRGVSEGCPAGFSFSKPRMTPVCGVSEGALTPISRFSAPVSRGPQVIPTPQNPQNLL